MVFVIISKQDQATDMAEIMLTRMGTAFATIALMLAIRREMPADSGKEINTGMDRDKVADVANIAGDKKQL